MFESYHQFIYFHWVNRKSFIKSGSGILGAVFLPAVGFSNNTPKKKFTIPPGLKPGDTIGVTCPSGYMTRNEMLPAFKQIQSWGFRIITGKTVDARDGTFGGSDTERAEDFQFMLDNPDIKAIMCGRGGYGAVRIIDDLDFSAFIKKPKWIIGFSDATVLHTHINSKYHIASIHSKMLNSFPNNFETAMPIQQDTILSIRDALMHLKKMNYTAPFNEYNKRGEATGELIGGNLRTIENLSGTASEIDTDGCILFLEETGEYLYNIDRMLWNLKRAGKLSKLKALIIGGFKIRQQTNPAEEMNRTVQQVVLEKVQEYDYPVCFDFPVGHQYDNFALKCGVAHRLTVTQSGTQLIEI